MFRKCNQKSEIKNLDTWIYTSLSVSCASHAIGADIFPAIDIQRPMPARKGLRKTSKNYGNQYKPDSRIYSLVQHWRAFVHQDAQRCVQEAHRVDDARCKEMCPYRIKNIFTEQRGCGWIIRLITEVPAGTSPPTLFISVSRIVYRNFFELVTTPFKNYDCLFAHHWQSCRWWWSRPANTAIERFI